MFPVCWCWRRHSLSYSPGSLTANSNLPNPRVISRMAWPKVSGWSLAHSGSFWLPAPIHPSTATQFGIPIRTGSLQQNSNRPAQEIQEIQESIQAFLQGSCPRCCRYLQVSPAPQPPLRGSRILQHVSWFVVAAT